MVPNVCEAETGLETPGGIGGMLKRFQSNRFGTPGKCYVNPRGG